MSMNTPLPNLAPNSLSIQGRKGPACKAPVEHRTGLGAHGPRMTTSASPVDLGFLGLILLLETIFFLVAFSFLVAASTKGIEVKVLVAAVDALVLFGSKLLAPEFLRYLNDEPIGGKKGSEAT